MLRVVALVLVALLNEALAHDSGDRYGWPGSAVTTVVVMAVIMVVLVIALMCTCIAACYRAR